MSTLERSQLANRPNLNRDISLYSQMKQQTMLIQVQRSEFHGCEALESDPSKSCCFVRTGRKRMFDLE